jgi:hypothetical protein
MRALARSVAGSGLERRQHFFEHLRVAEQHPLLSL